MVTISPFMRTLLAIVLSAILLGSSISEAAALPQEPTTLPDCPQAGVIHMTVSPFFEQDETLFMWDDFYLWRSTDGDATWQTVYQASVDPLGQYYLKEFTIAPVTSTENLQLYLTLDKIGSAQLWEHYNTNSNDGGDTWEAPRINSVSDCSWMPTNQEGTLFAYCLELDSSHAVPEGIHRSTDHGLTWQHVLPDIDILQLVPSPDYVNDQTAFAIRSGPNPMISTDGGLTWEDVAPGLCSEAYTNVRKIAVSPDFPVDHTLFGLAYRHLLKSEDGGISWQQVYPVNEDPCQYPSDPVWEVSLSPDYETDHTLFIRTSSGSYVSYDAGHHWRLLLAGRQISHIQARRQPQPAVNKSNPHQTFLPLLSGSGTLPRSTSLTLFAQTLGRWTYVRSDDGGITWRCVNPPSSALENISTQPGGGLP